MRHYSIAVLLAAATCGCFVGGCASVEQVSSDLATGSISAENQRPSDEGVAKGKKHFGAAEFGLAQRSFQAAVEANPKSAEAWLGLAASYDRLARYELADRAYERVIALSGRTSAVLNNLGYHYLLQGQLAKARENLLAAQVKDPGSVEIKNNLFLLDTWKSGEPTATERDRRL